MNDILEKPIISLLTEMPELKEFFGSYGIKFNKETSSLGNYLESLTENDYDDLGIDKSMLLKNMEGFIEQQEKSSSDNKEFGIKSLSILGGKDKSGVPENIRLKLIPGTITSIVGPTGSGKSRLLADIEWMAQNDTPTGRTILVDDKIPDKSLRFSLEHKLVAQLSQNMNFVMDTSTGEFIKMHARSRLVNNPEKMVDDIIAQANLLAGEQFSVDTPVTSLSGGQSRALMIADTAFLSLSPVVLIDEIENAGIDRKKAIGLLVRREKIVLMATHDPILALMAEQRLVIKNGGIHKIIKTSTEEKANLSVLEEFDNKVQSLRNRLRSGDVLGGDISEG